MEQIFLFSFQQKEHHGALTKDSLCARDEMARKSRNNMCTTGQLVRAGQAIQGLLLTSKWVGTESKSLVGIVPSRFVDSANVFCVQSMCKKDPASQPSGSGNRRGDIALFGNPSLHGCSCSTIKRRLLESRS